MSTWNLYRPGVAAIQAGPGPVGPPVPIEPGPKPVDPPKPAPTIGVDQAKRWYDRTMKTRDFLAANPNRRAAPMGRNADGSINYDRSQWSAEQIASSSAGGVPLTQASRATNAPPASGGGLRPGAFNGAATVTRPATTTQPATTLPPPPRLGTGGGGGY